MTLDNIRRIREIGDHLVDPELTAQIFEELSDALVLVDTKGVIQLVNRQTEVLFGYNRSELFDQKLDILLPLDRIAVHQQHVADFFAAPRRRPMGIGLYLLARRKDGSTFETEINLGPIVTPGGLFCIASVRVKRGGGHDAAP